MKRGIKSFGFFALVIIFGIILITLIVDRADAQNGSDWVSDGALTAVASDTGNVITFPPEPMSEKVHETVYSVLEKEFYSEPIEVRRRMIVTPVNAEPIPVERGDGSVVNFHGPDCQIGPFEKNPEGGFVQKRGMVGSFIIYEYTNRGKVGPITCPTGTLYFQRDFH